MKSRQFALHKNKYMLPLGKIAAALSRIDYAVNAAIAQMCQTENPQNIFIILTELNALSLRIRFARNLSKKVLSKTLQRRMNKYLNEIERLQTQRNDHLHSVWLFFTWVHPPYIARFARGNPTARTNSVNLTELRRLAKDSERCAKRFDKFVRESLVPAVEKRLDVQARRRLAKIRGRKT